MITQAHNGWKICGDRLAPNIYVSSYVCPYCGEHLTISDISGWNLNSEPYGVVRCYRCEKFRPIMFFYNEEGFVICDKGAGEIRLGPDGYYGVYSDGKLEHYSFECPVKSNKSKED